jgi:cysteine desulfurase
VPLIVGLGLAAELAVKDNQNRTERCLAIRKQALAALSPLGPRFHSDLERTLPHVLNFSVEGLDSEAIMVALKDLAAISNGSACTSHSYEPSHVLKAMGLPDEAIDGAVRVSWSHLTAEVNWEAIAAKISSLR